MTENTEKTREELEAELAALREAVQESPAAEFAAEETVRRLSTREQSPVKPQDHKPANGETITFEYRGETYEVDARFSRDVRTASLFNKNEFEAAITKMIGADGYEALLTSLEDEDGFVDAELVGGWVNTFFEKAGAKN